jgi:hypothetical protein
MLKPDKIGMPVEVLITARVGPRCPTFVPADQSARAFKERWAFATRNDGPSVHQSSELARHICEHRAGDCP